MGRATWRIGFVGIPLALATLRYGQDLVADLFDEALRDPERRPSIRAMVR